MKSDIKLLKRMNALRGRTITIGWIGAAFGGAALVIYLNIITAIALVAIRPNVPKTLPAVHIPDAVREATGTSLLAWAIIIVLMLVIYGFSIGIFKRDSIVKVLLVVALIGVCDWAINSPTRRAMLVIPSKLERYIQSGQYNEAEQILSGIYVPPVTKSYVKAQIALWANDSVALRSEGAPVIWASEAYIYRSQEIEEIEPPAAGFNAAVIHAIDEGINGHPVTGVSREYELRQSNRTFNNGRTMIIQGVAASVLAALSVLTLRLWLSMRQRIIRLNEFNPRMGTEVSTDSLQSTLPPTSGAFDDAARCQKCGSQHVEESDGQTCGASMPSYQEQWTDVNPTTSSGDYSTGQSNITSLHISGGEVVRGTQRMPAEKGLQWIADGWGHFRRSPLAWMGATVVSVVLPLLFLFLKSPISFLMFILLTPMVTAGFFTGADKQRVEGKFSLRHFLFAGNNSTQRFRLARIGFFQFLFMLVIIAVTNIMFEYVGPHHIHDVWIGRVLVIPLGAPLLVMLTLLMLLFMASLFAPALVTLGGLNPLTAFGLSIIACLKNIRPFFVLTLVFTGLLIFAMFSLGLGLLVLGPVMIAAIYSAYRDIFY